MLIVSGIQSFMKMEMQQEMNQIGFILEDLKL
jgi:hypothetical protein